MTDQRPSLRVAILLTIASILVATDAAPSIGKGLPIIPIAGFIGCREWKVLRKLLEYAREGDKTAEEKLASVTLLTGECTLFKDGEQVYPTEWGVWTGSVRLRRAGKTTEYWTTYPNGWSPHVSTAGKLSVIGPTP